MPFIKQMIDEFNLTVNTRFMPEPSNVDLQNLYLSAYALIYPSLYEGFGLPILEAMASGCPVITSKQGAMKEIAGNAAYLVNPESVNEISKALQTVLEKPSLANILRQKGFARVKQFSWEKKSRQTLSVYEKAYRS